MQTSAMLDGNDWVLVGEKTLISNGGIADFYVTFARTGEGEVGEAVMPREYLAAHCKAANIGPVLAVRHRELEEPGAAKLGHQRAAGAVGIRRMRVVDPLVAPFF
jgi:acyl-CoA dehydrogenase